MALLRYYSENIRIDDFTESEKKEITQILAAADALVFDVDNVKKYKFSDEDRYEYKDDKFQIVASVFDNRDIEYNICIIRDNGSEQEVFDAILLNKAHNCPLYSVSCYHGGDWCSEIWQTALERSAVLADTITNFGEL